MAYTIDWQLNFNGRLVKGGSQLAVSSCELFNEHYCLGLLDEAGEAAEFRVHSNINIGGKNYLLVFASKSSDIRDVASHTSDPNALLIMLRLLDKKRVCAMDQDRFSSLRNAVSMFLESGKRTALSDLQSVLV